MTSLCLYRLSKITPCSLSPRLQQLSRDAIVSAARRGAMPPAALLPLAPSPLHPNQRRHLSRCGASRRGFNVHTAIAIASASAAASAAEAPPSPSPPPSPQTQAPPSKQGSPVLGGIANTRSWSQYYGSGFSIRVPPSFDDILEPEDYNAGMTYYGDKAKPRAYAARFASPDRDEIVSVVIKPSNQLKITFLEAKDITDLGTLKEASKIFVPAGAKVFSARTIKVKDKEDIRTYYFYEFGLDKQHVALMATVNSGKTYIAGATAPETKWGDDGVKLRSAAVSLSVS
ncbi:hypothetical protein SETIT_3G249500v2 [Setaria italica]|uniref:PsbP C-terminal domain-containing protein n=1 Tax=Setaria italica TaxID=4555 RepID=A0A368QKL0_SETIT|nr:uncharacterized protein LOC101767296 [Setaria italica]RCV17810.1 hypothetical protein SETIT_3G249500v2 [Setaria italica]